MGMLVFPEEVVSGIPLIVGLVEGMAHIVASVTAYFQCSWVVSFVIDDIDTHHITIAETIVVHSGHCQLVDVARELYAIAVVLVVAATEQVVATSRKNHHSYG